MSDIGIPYEVKERNRELCKRFPFLIPVKSDDYDYEFTWLDDMPKGWRKAFGEQMCQDIMDYLVANNELDDYEVVQVKEKYGELRWYDNGHTRALFDIIDSYAEISGHTCVRCGKPATRLTKGWVLPYCDDCCEPGWQYTPI